MPLALAPTGQTALRLRPFFIAAALCIVGMGVSTHYPLFAAIPYALNFIAICYIAVMDGALPSLAGIVATILTRAVFLFFATPRAMVDTSDALRILIMLVTALLISILTRKRRIASAELEVAHASLQERTAALVESLHASKCASWVLDLASGQSARWYSGSYQIFGRPFEEIESLPSLGPLLHPDDRARFPELLDLFEHGTGPIRWEYRCPWPNGELHWLEMSATRVPGKNIVWRGLTVDITERKQTEAALLLSEKLAAMGRLASTVAHEINNPLEAVTNLLYLARTDETLSRDTRTYLATAEQELARLGEITRLTLGFVRNSASPQTVLVADIVDGVLAIFRHRMESRGIHIERRFEPEVHLDIVAHELRQVVTNLLSNAVDALSGPEARIVIEIARSAGSVHLVIEDNGCGIAPAQLLHIFDPFFTTKEDVGTGIGLWVTKELVEKNRGHISAESGNLPNQMKTRFRIDFQS